MDRLPGIEGRAPAVAEDSKGALWFASENGLFHLQGDRLQPVTLHPYISGPVIRLEMDLNDALWLCTRQGIGRLYRSRFINVFDHDDLDPAEIMSSYLDDDGSLWLGTARKGLFRVRDSNFANLTMREGLSSNQVNAVYLDSARILWIGTAAGLDRRTPEGTVTRFDIRNGLPRGDIQAIAEDSSGRIWVGGDSGLAVQATPERFVRHSLPGSGAAHVRALRAVPAEECGSPRRKLFCIRTTHS